MDCNTACRIAIRILAYEQIAEEGRHQFHVIRDKTWVYDGI
jgi:hypothetical protein